MAFEFFKRKRLQSEKKSKTTTAKNPTNTTRTGIFSAFTPKSRESSSGSGALSGFVKNVIKILVPTKKKKEKKEKQKEIVWQSLENTQMQARRQSLEVLRYAAEHPDDKTALEAAEQAQTFLERSLEGSGKKWADEAIAKRYLESKLSSVEGIEEAKKNRLAAFNNNFNLSISEDEWKVMDKIVGSSSFQKMLDVKSQFYDVMYQMVGDAVEQRYNPEKIKDVLDLYWQYDLDPEFSTFKDVLQMNNSEYRSLNNMLASVPEALHDNTDYNRMVSDFLKER